MSINKNNSGKITFGNKKKGKHSKNPGPKVKPVSKNRGQGRAN
jgi:hypothetical protein